MKVIWDELHFFKKYYYLRSRKKDVKQRCHSKKIKMPYLSTEQKATIFTTYGGSATNTGSIEAQIALVTERISNISKHLQKNKKDFSTNRGLMQLVGQRKRMLTYMQKHNLEGYRSLIEKLGLRK
jgi:small subunit ribosomal protein S15